MSDFVDFWLETARIQANSQRMFPMEDEMRPCFNPIEHREQLMREFENDRDRAEQVSESCTRCLIVTELEECPFCHHLYCEGCSESHPCTINQIIDNIDARNREYLEGKR